MDGKERTDNLQRVQAGDYRYSRNNLPGYSPTADRLVPRDVVDDQSENGDQRAGIAAVAGLGKLPDGMDDVA